MTIRRAIGVWLCLFGGACTFDTTSEQGTVACPDGECVVCDCAVDPSCHSTCTRAECEGEGAEYVVELAIQSQTQLTDYQVPVVLDVGSFAEAGVESPCEQIRFYDDAGPLPHWQMGACDAQTTFWVRVASSSGALRAVFGADAVSTSNGPGTFVEYDALAAIQDGWERSRVNYQRDHDVDAFVDDNGVMTTHASCYSRPYDGVGVVLQREVLLDEERYCVDVDVFSEIVDFAYVTTAHARAGLAVVGGATATASLQCEGEGCIADQGATLTRDGLTGLESVQLVGRAGDCVDARHSFAALRVRRCEATPVVAQVSAIVGCR